MSGKDIIRDEAAEDEMLPEYDFSNAVRGKHRFPILAGTVTLDSDVYDVFRTSEEVNTALRMLIAEGRVPHLSSRND